MSDVQVENHGSIFLLRPTSDDGLRWLNENISEDAQWFGNAVVCEPRYVEHIVGGMTIDGLEVK